jgi:hypothetical protein
MAIATINDTLNPLMQNREETKSRAPQIYTLSQLMTVSGRDKDGNMQTGYYDQSFFYLSFDERINIFRSCVPVNAVVTSRMNTIAALDFDVISDKQQEDRLYERLKNLKAIYDEYQNATDTKYIVAKGVILKEIKDTLPDILPDLSNFMSCLMRWRKRCNDQNTDQGNWIKSWMMQPNNNDTYEEFTKKQIFDLMIHGCFAAYKEEQNRKIENVYLLPGGAVFPLRNKFANGANAYVQVYQGLTDARIYYDDEMAFANWIPTTARGYGFIPLECLINKLAETMFFDKLMADQADGTNFPEKMVIVTDQNAFGDLNKEFSTPIPEEEQKRVEEKLNTPRKGKIMTFTGNNVQVVDLSKENTMAIQIERQKDIREEVGLVFQATSMEMNLAGGDNTSGRSTAEIQKDLYYARGVLPMIKILEVFWNRNVLPFRFGSGWKVEYKSGKSEIDDIDVLQKKVLTGIYSINELREEEGIDQFKDDEYNKPMGSQKPDGTQQNPLNFQGME